MGLQLPEVTISAKGPSTIAELQEIWGYRELLYFLVWRDVKVRYKQTVLGITWAILQPFLTMLVFSLFFGRLAHVPSDGVPYPLFTFAALVPWTLFSSGLSHAANSIVSSQNLVKKIYFPRILIPLAAVLSSIVDFGVALVMLFAMMPWFGMAPGIRALWIAPFTAVALLTAVGASLWMSALNVRYRDVQYVIPFLIQFWFYATPVAYSSQLLHEPWRRLYGINPMAGVVEGFRWSLFGTTTAFSVLPLSVACALAVFFSGVVFFKNQEKLFADLV